jgi:hypothetical protein
MSLCLLPVELLVQIVSYLQACTLFIEYTGRPTPLAIYPGWMRITHVCKHLREIALSTPQLWTHADVHWSPDLIALYLQRSMNVSLAVWYQLNRRTHYPTAMNSASLLLPRTQSLHLSIDDPEGHVRIEIAQLVSEATSHLLHLSLRSYRVALKWTPNYLGGCYQNLIRLELRCYELDKTPSFPSLMHLNLRTESHPSGVLSRVANFLRGLLKLVTLELEIPTVHSLSDLYSSRERNTLVYLPKLKSLKIESNSRAALELMYMIRPPTSFLSVVAKPYVNESDSQTNREIANRLVRFWTALHHKTDQSPQPLEADFDLVRHCPYPAAFKGSLLLRIASHNNIQTPGTLVFQGDYLFDRSTSEVLPYILSGTLSAGSLAAHISCVSQTDFDCFGPATRKVILEGRDNWYVSSDSLGDWMRTRCDNGWPALECLQLDGCDKT